MWLWGATIKPHKLHMAKYRIQVFSNERELLDTIECCVEENARIIAERVSREEGVYLALVNLGGGKYTGYVDGKEE